MTRPAAKRTAVTRLAAAAAMLITAPANAQANAISAEDKAVGAKANPELLASYGGRYAGPQQALVERVTKRVAVQSGLSNSAGDFTVALLDSPVENAFAIPGGYVYVTRQLRALMNSEDELAAVMGHEVGHVAARHAAARSKRSLFGQLAAAGLSAVTGSELIGRAAGYGTQLYTLKYGRDQEYAADSLGIRYSTAAGYSPYGMADMLTNLSAETELQGALAGRQGATPTWLSTHPNDAKRVQRAAALAEATGRGTPAATARQDTGYLRVLDGMAYDGPIKGAATQPADSATPKTLRIVTVGRGDTVDSLAARMAYATGRRERFLVLNGLEDDAVLTPGMLVKVVVAR